MPDDGEHREHLGLLLRCLPPCASIVGLLGNFLPGTKAVKDRAALESAIAKFGMDVAAVVVVQVFARITGGFIEREVSGLGEGERYAAQPGTICTVGG